MTAQAKAADTSIQRDNDYFTSTIVGLPTEVAMGRVYTKRKLSQHPTITIDAITAEVWHSEAAHALLMGQIKVSPKALGLPFAAGNFGRNRLVKSNYIAFLLGFSLCAILCYLYLTLPIGLN